MQADFDSACAYLESVRDLSIRQALRDQGHDLPLARRQ
jgi:hypothetical protein